MMLLELSMGDATISSITLGSSIMIVEVSFTLIYEVYRTGITNDDRQLTIEICLSYRPLISMSDFRLGYYILANALA